MTAPYVAVDPARFLVQVSDDGCRVDLWCLDCRVGDGYLLVVSTLISSLARFNWHGAEHERGHHVASRPNSADDCPPHGLARPRARLTVVVT